MHLVITDSGLGGLSVCAGIARAWRDVRARGDLHITYVNAWPEEGRGYNDFPGIEARAAVFDRALARIDGLDPDRILIACNTLSIVYGATARQRRTTGAPVQGIIEAGVGLFERALRADATASIVLVGTRTTIASGVHRDALLARGMDPARVTSASCHGLATAIEHGVTDASTAALIETCAERAATALAGYGQVFLGLCCTHYGLAERPLVHALAARVARPVTALDPNRALVDEVMAALETGGHVPAGGGPIGDARSAPEVATGATPSVTVVSKVSLSTTRRENVASLLQTVSPATADALRHYTHDPDLF